MVATALATITRRSIHASRSLCARHCPIGSQLPNEMGSPPYFYMRKTNSEVKKEGSKMTKRHPTVPVRADGPDGADRLTGAEGVPASHRVCAPGETVSQPSLLPSTRPELSRDHPQSLVDVLCPQGLSSEESDTGLGGR